jgi:hypothetical protein
LHVDAFAQQLTDAGQLAGLLGGERVDRNRALRRCGRAWSAEECAGAVAAHAVIRAEQIAPRVAGAVDVGLGTVRNRVAQLVCDRELDGCDQRRVRHEQIAEVIIVDVTTNEPVARADERSGRSALAIRGMGSGSLT